MEPEKRKQILKLLCVKLFLHSPTHKIPSFRSLLGLESCPLAMQVLLGERLTSRRKWMSVQEKFSQFLILLKPLLTVCEQISLLRGYYFHFHICAK